MSKPVILTGIRANNDLTIGNYFGAIMPMIDMAANRSDEYQVNLFVPDLHSFTTPIDHSQLQNQIMHNLRLFVAAGLPVEKTDIHVYRQSYVPAHSEMTWILDCFAGFGQLARMTQFKEKSSKLLDCIMPENISVNETMESFRNNVSVGLFNYPVLMACDILLYNSKYVPVGDDQTQHLEFTRDIAERMNSKFNQNLFVVPEPVKKQHEFFGNDQGLRIKDLQDPSKKMSKSDETGKGVIFLGDEPDAAAKKIMSATTDSLGSINLDWDNQPGISNLLQILALLRGEHVEAIEAEWKGNSSYGNLKNAVADATREFLVLLQARLANVDNNSIMNKLEISEKAMNIIANETLLRVQKAVGLRA
ncbi:MAG: tryptophan--tRNA ligase [Saprospiraceae bacterium]